MNRYNCTSQIHVLYGISFDPTTCYGEAPSPRFNTIAGPLSLTELSIWSDTRPFHVLNSKSALLS
jgi:hypothetical protein